jgi:hypothetical protein
MPRRVATGREKRPDELTVNGFREMLKDGDWNSSL